VNDRRKRNGLARFCKSAAAANICSAGSCTACIPLAHRIADFTPLAFRESFSHSAFTAAQRPSGKMVRQRFCSKSESRIPFARRLWRPPGAADSHNGSLSDCIGNCSAGARSCLRVDVVCDQIIRCQTFPPQRRSRPAPNASDGSLGDHRVCNSTDSSVHFPSSTLKPSVDRVSRRPSSPRRPPAE